MAYPFLPPSSAEIPADLIGAAVREGERDADRVAYFLDALGLARRQASDPPLRLPAGFVLDLAAGLRLLCWEQSGLLSHLDAGLPPACEALRAAFRGLTEPGIPDTDPTSGALMPRVWALLIERCAWNGRVELDADLVLGDVEEDAFADALADFVWTHRHDARLNPNTERGTP